MRTADSNRYLGEFLKQVKDGLDQFNKVDAILDENSVQVGLRKSVAEDAAFRLGALWEVLQGNHSSTYQNLVKGIVGDAESASLLDLLKKLRNLLAHGSTGSKVAFNRACRARPTGGKEGLTGVSNTSLMRDQRDVRDVGVYLRARVGPDNERRVAILHRRVMDVAGKLRLK